MIEFQIQTSRLEMVSTSNSLSEKHWKIWKADHCETSSLKSFLNENYPHHRSALQEELMRLSDEVSCSNAWILYNTSCCWKGGAGIWLGVWYKSFWIRCPSLKGVLGIYGSAYYGANNAQSSLKETTAHPLVLCLCWHIVNTKRGKIILYILLFNGYLNGHFCFMQVSSLTLWSCE
jgi:hypothetical protein